MKEIEMFALSYWTAMRGAKSSADQRRTHDAQVRRKITDVQGDAVRVGFEHEDPQMFSHEHDQQLLLWMNTHPEDWTQSWAAVGGGAIYGWGHNHRGR